MGDFTINNGVLEEYFTDNSGKGVIVPKGVVTIGRSAFFGQDNMGVVTLPEGVKTICDSAFSDCFGTPEVVIPSTVTRIEIHAFYGSDIKTLTLPRGLKYLGRCAFGGCMFLENIVYRGTVAEFNRIEKEEPMVTLGNESTIVHCIDGDVQLDY